MPTPSFFVGSIKWTRSALSNYQQNANLVVPVVAAAPGLFTSNATGSGQAAAVNQDGSYNVTQMLLKLGHRRLALINGPSISRDAWEREQGFTKALKEYHVSLDSHAIVHGMFSIEAGVHGWEQLRQCSQRPTAILCGNDEIAFGVLEALAKDKIKCPQEVSVVGFDDSRLSLRVMPPLTTVRQPIAELGRAAVELLAARLRNPSHESRVEHRVLPLEIVNRQSVAPPPSGSDS